ncbi:MAG: hypothetical protein ACRDQU_15665, partial [Pseudonocardiaceae bacterium]
EIRTQRSRIGTLIGNLRDLEQNHPHQSVEHLTAENTTLKHRVISSPRTTASWRNGSTPPAQTSASKTADSPTSKPSCSTMPTINNTTSGPIRYPRHLHARDAKSQLRDITDITTAGKLECNPGEQFGWLEARTGAPVTEALADLLAAGAS